MFEMVPFKKSNNSISNGGDYFDKLLGNFFNDDFLSPSNFIGNAFRVDLKENEYIIEADLPGIKKEAINIEYDNDYITVSAKRDNSVEDKKDNYVRRERHYGEFKRSFYINNIEADKIEASFTDGVLNIKLPKITKGVVNKKNILRFWYLNLSLRIPILLHFCWNIFKNSD